LCSSLSIKRINLIERSSKDIDINIGNSLKDNFIGETGNKLEEADCYRFIKTFIPLSTITLMQYTNTHRSAKEQKAQVVESVGK
jgi:hypothetical protein